MIHRLTDLPALVGLELGVGPWTRVRQSDLDAFAELTGDHQWIHVDPVAAAAGPFGVPIAHGYFVMSLIGGWWGELFQVADAAVAVNYGMDRVRFVSPVPVGARLRLRSTLAQVDSVPSGLRLHVDQTIEREGSEKPALVARCLYDFRTRMVD